MVRTTGTTQRGSAATQPRLTKLVRFLGDHAITLAVVMLLVWAGVTITGAPGWVHLLLTLGVFLLIWGVVRRGTSSVSGATSSSSTSTAAGTKASSTTAGSGASTNRASGGRRD